jgi:hypothetical protein
MGMDRHRRGCCGRRRCRCHRSQEEEVIPQKQEADREVSLFFVAVLFAAVKSRFLFLQTIFTNLLPYGIIVGKCDIQNIKGELP